MEDFEEKSKRVRNLLSSYYGPSQTELDTEGGTAGWKSDYDSNSAIEDVNGKAFDADRYVDHLIQSSRMSELLKQHVSWSAEIKNLDSDMQMLVYENYNKFISATDTIRRMKDNVSGMEESMERLLSTISSVREKSDSINSCLSKRREKIEQLNGTRNLLRKIQYIFDLPKRLRKMAKEESFSLAVEAYIGALPIFNEYGNKSFASCKEESDEEITSVIKKLEIRLMDDEISLQKRAEYASLLQKLDRNVERTMEDYLSTHFDNLLRILQDKKFFIYENESDRQEIAKEFFSSLKNVISSFSTIFPQGESILIENTQSLFQKYFEIFQENLVQANENHSLSDLISALVIVSKDVVKVNEIFPNAKVPDQAIDILEVLATEFVLQNFSNLNSEIIHSFSLVVKKESYENIDNKFIRNALKDSQKCISENTIKLLSDLSKLKNSKLEMLEKFKKNVSHIILSELHSLFSTILNFFQIIFFYSNKNANSEEIHNISLSAHSWSSKIPSVFFPPPPILILFISKISNFIEENALPSILEYLGSHFQGLWEKEESIFHPTELSVHFRFFSEKFLRQFIDDQTRKLSLMIQKNISTPNWFKYKDVKDVRMVCDMLLQEVHIIFNFVHQILPSGTDRPLGLRQVTNSKEVPRNTYNHERTPPVGSSINTSASRNKANLTNEKSRSRLLERDVAKLFTQKVEIFSKPSLTQSWVISTLIKLSLKSFQECVRLETFNKNGFQQIQLDAFYLKNNLRCYFEDEAIVDMLLDEVSSAAAERCVEPVQIEPSLIQRIMEAKKKTSV